MTASTIATTTASSTSHSFGRFAGLKPLLRKDVTEWVRGRRAWIVFAATTAFMTLSAANGAITAAIAANLPPDVAPPEVGSLVPLDNLLAAVGSQLFVLATIFAVASLLVREREAGTLAWVASKPVSRSSIWLSKWISASGMLAVSAAIAPLAITSALVVVLYGAPPIAPVVGIAGGMVAVVIFFAAVGLAAGTVMPSQPAIAATGFAVFALVPLLAGIIPFDIAPFLPTSILGWAGSFASGENVGVVTPISWAVVTGALVLIAIRQIRRIEL